MMSKIFFIQHYILPLILFQTYVKTETADEKPDCKTQFTYGYIYDNIFRLPESSFNKNQINLKFFVKAKSDAHILLATSSNIAPSQPVYEIILGGGKNTFSEIRRSRITSTKVAASIPNLLSANEVRGFWLRITQDGIIEVGKLEEDTPFIFWQDPTPLQIKYFSFSTWTGVFGTWFFDCKSFGNNDTTTLVQKPQTWTERLRHDLLKDYDPQVIPKINFNERLDVYTKLEWHHVELDSKKSEITVTGLIGMTWTDEKLKWEPSKYGGIKVIQLIHGEVWRPELVLYNAVEHGAEPLSISGVVVTAAGEVAWTPMTRLQAHCKLDLSSWPWDTHTCPLKLGFWALKDFLKLVLLKNGTELSKQRTTSQWKLVSIEAETTRLKTPWFDSDVINPDDSEFTGDSTSSVLPTDTAVVIKVTVNRLSSIYTYVLLIPLIVTATVCLISFGLSPIATEKIGMQCICLLLGSMFIIKVDNSLPSSADHIPYIFKAYSESMIMVTVSIAASVFIMTIIRQPHYKPPHHLIVTILEWSPLKLLLCLPETNFDGLQLLDEPNDELTSENSSHHWGTLATVLDRITMIFTVICIIHILIFC